MALSFYFTPSGFTPEVYDQVVSRLEAEGAGAPAGRLYHAALESDGQIQVFDVWDSQESVEAFLPTVSRAWRRPVLPGGRRGRYGGLREQLGNRQLVERAQRHGSVGAVRGNHKGPAGNLLETCP